MAGRTRPRRARFRKQTALRFFRSAVFVPVDLLCRPAFFRFGRSDETFLFGKRIIFIENFAGTNFHSIFAVPKRRFRRRHAEIAQLVERNLAKVEVAGPSPVFRSREARVAKERRIARFSFLFFGGAGFDARDLKAPLSGAGGVNNESRPSLALCASPVFRFRKKGRILRLFPFCFVCMVQGLVPFPGFGCRFRQGVADCIADRPATYRKKGSVL